MAHPITVKVKGEGVDGEDSDRNQIKMDKVQEECRLSCYKMIETFDSEGTYRVDRYVKNIETTSEDIPHG